MNWSSLGAATWLAGHEFELPLRDALGDPELDPVRRALAVLAIGTGLNDGHLAAAELSDAARQLAADRHAGIADSQGRGAAEIRRILQAPCDDYQRALWYAVSRCSTDAAVGHLAWLAALMAGRAAMFRAIRDAGATMPLLPRNDTGESAQLGTA